MKKYAKVGLIQGTVFLIISIVLLLLVKKPWKNIQHTPQSAVTVTTEETVYVVEDLLINPTETSAEIENTQIETESTQVEITQTEIETAIPDNLDTKITQSETETQTGMLKIAENSLVGGVQQTGIGYVASKNVYYYNGVLLYSFDIIMTDNLVLPYYTSKTIYDSVAVGTQLTITFDIYTVQNASIYAINSISLV